MKNERIRKLNTLDNKKGPVVYWMSRDQRVKDNWAIIHAQNIALELKSPLLVVFCLIPEFLGATVRQYGFMLRGLVEVEKDLALKKISFSLCIGSPEQEILKFIKKNQAGILITDFDPLKIKQSWKKNISKQVRIPFYEIDAHNIVPCWIASPKQEFGAYTLRPKINRILQDYLDKFPNLKRHPFPKQHQAQRMNIPKLLSELKINKNVPEVSWVKPGEKAAKKTLKNFISNKLNNYSDLRNAPNKDGQSNLSPYLHFGQISAQRVALEVAQSQANTNSQADFLEELIIRRELSDNFCFYNKNYDNVNGVPNWAKTTLSIHTTDKREYHYSLKHFEQAKTHDDLWNAAQIEMVKTGKMHGYMRMYWAKKILEWTRSPKEAFKIAIYLNDKYELDGRDPNGYAGIAWSIGGVHDRAWGERAVLGKVRYMSYNGCKSKFDINEYINQVNIK